jgi:hypothetical protein
MPKESLSLRHGYWFEHPVSNCSSLLVYAWELAKDDAITALSADEMDMPEGLIASLLNSGLWPSVVESQQAAPRLR